ncbi:DUF1471 domain-containing protein [Dickeya undicola]|uniref:DUF1471 domain-containing protein n=1 Tax=Dickeya undicola TaxID=1577887 RepID=A0ABX9WUN1_9GAMM|nr:DUF1471 domain-containing protein [Dickeya undicola]
MTALTRFSPARPSPPGARWWRACRSNAGWRSVSATAATLDSLQASLSEKAQAAGAKSFRIISATSGENQVRGVAELYN